MTKKKHQWVSEVYTTAKNYDLKIGDQVELLVPEPTGKTRIGLKKKNRPPGY